MVVLPDMCLSRDMSAVLQRTVMWVACPSLPAIRARGREQWCYRNKQDLFNHMDLELKLFALLVLLSVTECFVASDKVSSYFNQLNYNTRVACDESK